jgi:hypothetical protein
MCAGASRLGYGRGLEIMPRLGGLAGVETAFLHLDFVFPRTLEVLARLPELRQALAEGFAQLRQFPRAKYDQGNHQND